MDIHELRHILARYAAEIGVEELIDLLLDWVTRPYYMELAAAALDELTPREEEIFDVLSHFVTIRDGDRARILSRNVTNRGGKRRGDGYQVEITTKLPVNEARQLDRIAEQLNLSRYELVRRTLRDALWLSSAPRTDKGCTL